MLQNPTCSRAPQKHPSAVTKYQALCGPLRALEINLCLSLPATAAPPPVLLSAAYVSPSSYHECLGGIPAMSVSCVRLPGQAPFLASFPDGNVQLKLDDLHVAPKEHTHAGNGLPWLSRFCWAYAHRQDAMTSQSLPYPILLQRLHLFFHSRAP